MKKPVHLDLSILNLSKSVMYEIWSYYIKPKYDEREKLCYMKTHSFIFHVKTNNFCKDISEDVKKRFDNSNYEIYRKLPKEKNKKLVGLMKDELGDKL